jgi:hypothetical protein
MNARRTRRNYTKEFKADAVGLVVEQGCSSAEVGRTGSVAGHEVDGRSGTSTNQEIWSAHFPCIILFVM